MQEAALLGGDDLGHRQGLVLQGHGENRQAEGQFGGGDLGQTATDADGGIGVAALAGAQGHAQGAEEDEIEGQDEVTGEGEVGEHRVAVQGRHEENQADAPRQPEDRPQVEVDTVADGGAQPVVLDQIHVVLPDGDAVAAPDPGGDLGDQGIQQQAVVEDDKKRQEGIGDLHPVKVHGWTPRPHSRRMTAKARK